MLQCLVSDAEHVVYDLHSCKKTTNVRAKNMFLYDIKNTKKNIFKHFPALAK